jgi:hypothetical protein
MHATTAQYLASAHEQDLRRASAQRDLADQARPHGTDELRPRRGGPRLPHIPRPLRGRRPAPGAATA